MLSRFDRRRLQPEIMDQPGLNESAHAGALRALERINGWSASAGILWPAIRDLAQAEATHPLRILDIASGAGDVPIRLWHKARRAGIALYIDGCDCSPLAVRFATERAAQAKADVRFFALDALADTVPSDYDVITSSLFLHHLDEPQALELLRRMSQAARRLVLVNDLARGALGFALAWLGTRLLCTSWVARVDGPRSVEGAFTAAEALALAQRAGLDGAKVASRWPCRFLLSWARPPCSNGMAKTAAMS